MRGSTQHFYGVNIDDAWAREVLALDAGGEPAGRRGGRDRQPATEPVGTVATRGDRAISDLGDAEVEAIVLRKLLSLHPAQATVDELIRDVADDPDDFAERDAVERAVRDLARAGLAHRNGEFALPSIAALRFGALLDS